MEFYQTHADAQEPLETWYRICRKAAWSNFSEVKQIYPSTDWVGDGRVVFNIKGNNYRLVVRFSFKYKSIQVKWIGTHAECNKGVSKNPCSHTGLVPVSACAMVKSRFRPAFAEAATRRQAQRPE
ncbi:MAG: type II toxin-antitoxin system HigB family toxin [Cyclobacteriaceae bacterium]|nr:type II toxin-antitoxin system HigB family toxin [Cyclobacteriaceae bacterium]